MSFLRRMWYPAQKMMKKTEYKKGYEAGYHNGAKDCQKLYSKILDYIWKLKEKLGFTLIMVTHNQNIADLARTIIRVNSGKITQVVTNDQPQNAYEIGW